jgi:hypothetical protein
MRKTLLVPRHIGRSVRVRVLMARGVWALHVSVAERRRRYYTITHMPSRLALTTWIRTRRTGESTLREVAALPGDWTFTEDPTKAPRAQWPKWLLAAYRINERFQR